MNTDELVAAVLVSLLRQGHHAATLECLTHGDGRGTVPPNTLANALAPIAAQLTEARESERAAVVAFCRSERAPFAMSYFPEDGKPYERQFYGGEFADAIERGEHLT